jgi:hypothetical protein
LPDVSLALTAYIASPFIKKAWALHAVSVRDKKIISIQYWRSISMNRNSVARTLFSSVFVLLLLSPTACHLKSLGIQIGEEPRPMGGPPPHAPAHGYRAKHNYHYYPSAQVYFDISRRVYFYLDGDNWKMTVSLPTRFRIKLGEHVAIEMDSDKPYTQFEKHKKKYPPGQLKKKKRKKWS